MNLSPLWVTFLREADWESVHWSQLGKGNAPDSKIMSYAAQNNMVVMTRDLDFAAILAVTQGRKPSVVQIRSQDISTERIGRQTLSALSLIRVELEAGALLTIEFERTRLRLLPLT